MNKKKSKVLYKIISIATLTLPISVYTLIYALLYSITPNAIVFNDTALAIERDDMIFVYAEENVSYDGFVVFDDELQVYGVLIEHDDIVKIGNGYFKYKDNQLINVKDIVETETKSGGISIWFVVTAFSISVATLVIMGKMKVLAGKLELSTLLALVTLTIILGILEIVISNMFNVFLIFTISWAIYCVERKIYYSGIKQTQREKMESEVVNLLKQALK